MMGIAASHNVAGNGRVDAESDATWSVFRHSLPVVLSLVVW